MKMNLSHYSDVPLKTLKEINKQSVESKPRGLWVSVDDEYDWPWWCNSENFHLDKLNLKHSVILKKEANILIIDNLDSLDKFTDKYKVIRYQMGEISFYDINWPLVAVSFDGIIIAPYQWERRLEPISRWYYGWDCASGCIWNNDIIESINIQSDWKNLHAVE